MREKIAGIFVLLFGATSWTPVGREFLRAIFWDRVVHFVSPIFSMPLNFVLEYGLPAAATVVMIGRYSKSN